MLNLTKKAPLNGLILAAVNLVHCAYATSNLDKQAEIQTKIESLIKQTTPKQPEPASAKPNKTNFSSAEIIQQPRLLTNLLLTALNKEDLSQINFLFNLYQQISQPNTEILLYSQATTARLQGNLKLAITNYQQILRNNPNLANVRLALAKSLVQDKQYNNAQQQFQQMQKINELPVKIANLITRYQQLLRTQNRWHFNLNLAYLYNDNLNNASQQSIYYVSATKFWRLAKPEIGQAVRAKFQLSKDYNLLNNHYLNLTTEYSLINYFQLKQPNQYLSTASKRALYDENKWRLNLGWSYKTAQLISNLALYYQTKTSNRLHYQDDAGISHELNYQLQPRWLLFNYLEYGAKSNQQYNILNGYSLFLSSGLIYLFKPTTSFYLSYSYNHEDAQRKDLAYIKQGVSLGINQSWQALTLGLNLGYFKTNYQARDLFPLIRHDHTYSVKLNLTANKLNFYGLVPKLEMSKIKIASNHFMHQHKNIHSLTLSFNKYF